MSQWHCPLAWPWRGNTGGPGQPISIQGKSLDLRAVCAFGNIPPLNSANFSYYAETLEPQGGNTRVRRKFLRGSIGDVRNLLASRILLPYGASRLYPLGQPGEVRIEGTVGQQIGRHFGVVRFEVVADDIDPFDIGNVRITPAQNPEDHNENLIYVLFANTPSSSLHGVIAPHCATDPLANLAHYYSLMGNRANMNPSGPTIYPRADSPGNGQLPIPGEDSTCDLDRTGNPPTFNFSTEIRASYIDPFNCAVGFADPPA